MVLNIRVAALAASFIAAVYAQGNFNPVQLLRLAEQGLDLEGNTIDGADRASNFAIAAENITAEYVELPLDHFGHGEGSFRNRFWVAESGYKPGGPVFIYDWGEADAGFGAVSVLTLNTYFLKQIVDAYGGIGIIWEHRFYGESTPVPITHDTPPEAFEFLTTEQSLEDVKVFAEGFSRSNFPDVDFTPAGTPWVFIGGSYPGMRAAFMRDKYAEIITASFASSAPVEAAVDMSAYYEPVYRGMDRYGYGNCSRDFHAAITYLDKELEDETRAAELKVQFFGEGAGNNTNAVFADALSSAFWQWQSSGMNTLVSLCDSISTEVGTNKTSPAEGWAPTKGPEYVVGRWSNHTGFKRIVNAFFNTTCGTGAGKECNLDKPGYDPSAISWTWQYCTQWGYFQSANLGPTQIVSKFNSLQHQADICHRQFPSASEPLFPAWPRTNETNAEFGGFSLRPSNVYWSGGEFDPWLTLSPLSEEPFAPEVVVTEEVPECEVETGPETVFGFTLPNSQHCYDFRLGNKAGEKSRGLFRAALDKWLGCWAAKKGR